MSKLYPPSIEGKLPACAGDVLVVPFTMNRAVSVNEVGGMSAIIKTISTGAVLGVLSGAFSPGQNTGKYSANFDLSQLKTSLNMGQYYKVQIAYKHIRDGSIGYYSSVGVFKKTTTPSVTIPQLDNNMYSGYDYTGLYSQQNGDTTEKAYSYCFELYDAENNLIDTSGIQIHDSSKDNINTSESQDTWKSNIELQKDIPYQVVYKVTTMNGLEVASRPYMVINQDSIDIDLNIQLNSKLLHENGSIKLSIVSKTVGSSLISGNFILVRSSSINNFTSWDEVYRFDYLNVALSDTDSIEIWEDYTVQQGEEYLYALQAYNSKGLYSNRMNSVDGKIKVDFEDIFICDADRQLKVRFNPKVSSFKNNVVESKIDTIGSKYPFIFKNGYVHYKEFQISGLISMLCDENETFYKQPITTNETGTRVSTPSYLFPSNKLSTDLTAENIYNERQFKLEVLEWLNNGKPKIFRSATEGNYIVRIMNVSLTPNDTLGRMLHSFQCTAYEIADWNFNNLNQLNLINIPNGRSANVKIAQIQPSKMMEITDAEKFQEIYPIFEQSNTDIVRFKIGAYNVNITEATPGTTIAFTFADTTGESINIEIGGTGAYYVQMPRSITVFQIQLKRGKWDDMKITFEYDDYTPTDAFSQISNFTTTDEIRRIVGPGYTINLMVDRNYGSASVNNILTDIRREIGTIHYLRAEKRFVQEVWPTGNGKWSRNPSLNDIIQDDEWVSIYLYHNNATDTYYSGNMKTRIAGEPDYRLGFNDDPNEFIDLGGNGYNEWDEIGIPEMDEQNRPKYGPTLGRIDALRNIKDLSTLRVGNGVMIDIAYRVRVKEYVIEDTDNATREAKRAWLGAKNYLEAMLKDNDNIYITAQDIERQRLDTNEAYEKFIITLREALKKEGVVE